MFRALFLVSLSGFNLHAVWWCSLQAYWKVHPTIDSVAISTRVNLHTEYFMLQEPDFVPYSILDSSKLNNKCAFIVSSCSNVIQSVAVCPVVPPFQQLDPNLPDTHGSAADTFCGWFDLIS